MGWYLICMYKLRSHDLRMVTINFHYADVSKLTDSNMYWLGIGVAVSCGNVVLIIAYMMLEILCEEHQMV